MRFLVIIAVITSTLSASATTVVPQFVNCPVCVEDFVVTAVSSFSQFGEPARDLSDSPARMFDRPHVCPYCLFAALPDDFESLPEDQARAFERLLPSRLKLGISDEEKATLTKIPAKYRPYLFQDAWTARACYEQRPKSDREQLTLALRLFYSTARRKGPGVSDLAPLDDLHIVYRRQAVKMMAVQLAEGDMKPEDKAVNTYLIGELLRQDRLFDSALEMFAEATALAKALPKPKDPDDSYEWISNWSAQQTVRAQYGKRSLKELAASISAAPPEKWKLSMEQRVALEVLNDRTDAAAWQTLADYLIDHPDRLYMFIDLCKPKRTSLRINDRLWKWTHQTYQEMSRDYLAARAAGEKVREPPLHRELRSYFIAEWHYQPSADDAKVLDDWLPQKATKQVTVKRGDTLIGIGKQFSANGREMQLLNPQIKNPKLMRTGSKVNVPNRPHGWRSGRILMNLPVLLEVADKRAIEYFVDRCDSSTDLDQEVRDLLPCLAAVARSGKAASISPDLPPTLQPLLAYFVDPSTNRLQIISNLRDGSPIEAAIAVNCMIEANDKELKPLVVERLAAGTDSQFTNRGLEYMRKMGTAQDIASLTLIAASRAKRDGKHDYHAFGRMEVEEIIRQINIRELMKRQ
jgi:nucleoid-associated protein YgaU